MLVIKAMIGFAVLVMGRQLFWVAVSGLGFALGMMYAPLLVRGSAGSLLLFSLALGVVGAILSYYLQRAAAGLVGFLAGWYLTLSAIWMLNLPVGNLASVLALGGGIVGALLIAILFDWSLVILSSMAGAAMIIQTLPFGPTTRQIIFIILAALGTAIQGVLLVQEQSDFN